MGLIEDFGLDLLSILEDVFKLNGEVIFDNQANWGKERV